MIKLREKEIKTVKKRGTVSFREKQGRGFRRVSLFFHFFFLQDRSISSLRSKRARRESDQETSGESFFFFGRERKAAEGFRREQFFFLAPSFVSLSLSLHQVSLFLIALSDKMKKNKKLNQLPSIAAATSAGNNGALLESTSGGSPSPATATSSSNRIPTPANFPHLAGSGGK